ncbi:MAG TPA: hypothetical protein PLV45_12590, partial [bacterium]|nr:hypothetical protein [bacterium]
MNIQYSLIENGYPGTGNISGDPCFVNAEAFDFRLRWDSPCIDAGYPGSPVPPGGGVRIDMGPLEYLHAPQPCAVTVAFDELAGDDDGIPEFGETIRPMLELCNTGQPAQNLVMDFVADHPDITITDPFVDAGAMDSGETKILTGPIFEVTGESGYGIPVSLTGEHQLNVVLKDS